MLPSLREAEVSGAHGARPFPLRVRSLPPGPDGSGASSEGARMSGRSWGWPEPHRRLDTAGERDGSSAFPVEPRVLPLDPNSHRTSTPRQSRSLLRGLREAQTRRHGSHPQGPVLFRDNDRDSGHHPHRHSGHSPCVDPALLCAKPRTKRATHVSLSSCLKCLLFPFYRRDN